MTDALVIDEKALFRKYIREGYQPKDALALARREPGGGLPEPSGEDYGAPTPFAADYQPNEKELRAARGDTTSRTVSAARGIAQGASARFADELAGGIGAMANAVADIHQGRNPADRGNFVDQYRSERDAYRRADQVAREDNPKTFFAGELAGGLATAPLAGNARTVGAAAKAGAKIGSLAGLGGSQADLTKGEIGQAALDTGIGTGAGVLAGVAGYGAIKTAGAAGKRVVDWAKDRVRDIPAGSVAEAELAGTPPVHMPASVERAAGDAAQSVADQANAPSAIGRGMNVRSAFEEAQQLERYYRENLGVSLRFTPAQSTGSRAAALRQLRIRNSGGPQMDAAQAFESEQLFHAAKATDVLVDRVAADPSALGRPATSDAITGTVTQGMKALYKQRSAVADPLYDQFRLMGGRIDGRPIVAEAQAILAENKLNPSSVTKQLGSLLDKLKDASRGGLSIEDANNFRKLMGQVMMGQASILDGVDMDAQAAIAARMRNSVDQVFDDAARMGGKSIDEAGAARLTTASNDASITAQAANDAAVKSKAAATAQAAAAAAKADAARTADPSVAVKKLALAKIAQEQADRANIEAAAAQKAASKLSNKADRAAAALDTKNAANGVIQINNERADAINILRQANAAWAAGSKAIDEHGTATVMRLVRAASKGQGEAEGIPRQLLGMEDGQVKAIFKLLNKTNPLVARQTRAQMLEEALVQFGKPARGATMTAERGLTQISPQAALSKTGLPSMESAFNAAYEGDPVAQNALKHTFLMLERLRFGPNIKGSSTFPQAADALATLASVPGLPAPVRAIFNGIAGAARNDTAMADAMSTSAGIRGFNAALSLAFKAKAGVKISDEAMRAAVAGLARAGVDVTSGALQQPFRATSSPTEQPDEPPPEPPRPIAQQ